MSLAVCIMIFIDNFSKLKTIYIFDNLTENQPPNHEFEMKMVMGPFGNRFNSNNNKIEMHKEQNKIQFYNEIHG